MACALIKYRATISIVFRKVLPLSPRLTSRALSAALAFALLLGGCSGMSGQGGSIPGINAQKPNNAACPNGPGMSPVVHAGTGCGGGQPPTGWKVSARFLDGYTYGNPSSDGSYSANGIGTDISYNQTGSSTGSTSADPADPTETFNVNIPSLNSQSYSMTTIAAPYLAPGTFTLPGGGTLTVNGTTGVATATKTISGATWSVTAVLDADGHDVDITWQSPSQGISFQEQVDANIIAPTSFISSSSGVQPYCVAGHIRVLLTLRRSALTQSPYGSWREGPAV